VEKTWTQVIRNVIIDLCNSVTQNNISADRPKSFDAVSGLLFILQRAKDISLVELCQIPSCAMSAHSAFLSAASSSLKLDILVEIATILAVKISTLLDASKAKKLGRSAWNRAISDHIELANLILSGRAVVLAEFAKMYEILLSRRILRLRSVSLSDEQRVVQMLPPMERAKEMLLEVRSGPATSFELRLLLLKQHSELVSIGVGRSREERASPLSQLVRLLLNDPNAFTVMTISAGAWSQRSLYESKSLNLPPLMQAYAQKFEDYFLSKQCHDAKINIKTAKDKTGEFEKTFSIKIGPENNDEEAKNLLTPGSNER
jgi:hypothetical protein